MTQTQRSISQAPRGSRPRVRRRRWLSVLVAMASATAAQGLADPVAGIDLTVTKGSSVDTVGSLGVTLTALFVGLAGWGLLELLERRTTRAAKVWRIVAGSVLVLSLLGPLGATTASATVVLLGLHLLVGGILLWGLGWSPALAQRNPGTASGPRAEDA